VSHAEHDSGSVAASISDAMVGLHRDHFGRGAAKARTMLQGDWVVCVLEGIFTVEEQRLISAQRFDMVRETRTAVGDSTRSVCVARIEELTGRSVVAVFSQVHRDPEMALEMFVLAPISLQ
jgi:uncharacterized protein YbcI